MAKRGKLVLERVKALLEKYPELRDDDRKLILEIWREEMASKQVSPTLPFRKVFTMKDGEGNDILTFPDSITRSRRSIQHDFVELRGKSYDAREEEQEEYLRELGYRTPSGQGMLFAPEEIPVRKAPSHDEIDN